MEDVLVLIGRRDALKTDIKKLETELERIENELKTLAKDAFANTPPSTTERVANGVRFRRKTLRTQLKSSTPRLTARWLAENLPVDVFSPSMVQKAKLDSVVGITYLDGRVLFQDEVIPGLATDLVYGYDYSPAAAMTAGDLDDDLP